MLICAVSAFAASPEVQIIDDFNNGLNATWEFKEFKGQTHSITEQADDGVLMAFNDCTSSA